jgi:hypothetical protein
MSDKSILFYSDTLTARLRYVAQFVFEDMLGLALEFTHDKHAFAGSFLPKINYSVEPISPSAFFIKSHRLLFESHVSEIKIQDESDFFSHPEKDTFPNFDILARIFYILSRYEEYTAPPSVFDSHQRFTAAASLQKRLSYLHQPIVNQWIIALRAALLAQFPNLHFAPPQYFCFQPSFDIDMVWRYKHKGWRRTIGGMARDFLKGKFYDIPKRVKILRGVQNDPDYIFDYLFQIHANLEIAPIFFFLLGDLGKYDKNIYWQNPALGALVKIIADRYRCGLHPSYASNQSIHILEKEKSRFETLTHRPLQISRQHFLKLRFPETYQRLLALGIKEDWSLGYADDIGFRAGVASPFRWFDLVKDEATDLVIHPFQIMDVTLRDYLRLSPEEAFSKIETMISTIKNVGGTFTTLWHNSSFSEEWADWRVVYERMIDIITSSK